MHIVSFVETWNDSCKSVNNIPSFTCICNSTRKKHRRTRRGSGGIAGYVKNCISKGVSNLSCRHSDIVWIKLDSKFFSLSRDVFIAVVYFSPDNSSSCTEDINTIYSRLLRNIEHCSQLGDIVIQGDFNAQTNTVPDFVISDSTEFSRPIDNEYSIDSHISRNNLDNKHTNESDKLLIDLCKESGIRILNGRTIGDLRGKCTYITYNGRSVVDCTLVSCNLLHVIGNFIVNDFTPLSDHCPISCSILTCFQGDNNGMNANLDPMPGKFI
jgi:exonuclease III